MKPVKWSNVKSNCPVCEKEYIAIRPILAEDVPLKDGVMLWDRWVLIRKEYLHKDGQYCIELFYEYKPVKRKFTLREGNKDVYA